jgi:exosome complex component CSL4
MDTTSQTDPVVPGTTIGSTKEYEAGEGTYTRGESILASLVGFVKQTSSSSEESSSSTDSKPPSASSSKPTLSVEPVNAKPSIVPKERSIVLAQVVKINPRFASVAILSVDDVTLPENFPGSIRVSDVRMAQAEQVEIYKCFRPGDIVRAEVISLGDSRAYYLSTARNEYGVVMAKSISGHVMVPVSWNLMQCPKTKMKEYRKVAKT